MNPHSVDVVDQRNPGLAFIGTLRRIPWFPITAELHLAAAWFARTQAHPDRKLAFGISRQQPGTGTTHPGNFVPWASTERESVSRQRPSPTREFLPLGREKIEQAGVTSV